MTSSASQNSSVAVSLTDLHKYFGDLEVLKGVTMKAHEGEVVSILGSSGSGKSTMLRCINMLETPTSGTVTVGEETIKLVTDRKGVVKPADRKQVDRLRTRVGMVFQSFNLWSHKTILENVIEAPIHVQGETGQTVSKKPRISLPRSALPTSAISTLPIFRAGSSSVRPLRGRLPTS